MTADATQVKSAFRSKAHDNYTKLYANVLNSFFVYFPGLHI